MTKKQKLRTGFLDAALIWGLSDSLPLPSELNSGSCCQCVSYLKEKCSLWDGRRLLVVAYSQLHMSLLGYGVTQQKESCHKSHSMIVGHKCQMEFFVPGSNNSTPYVGPCLQETDWGWCHTSPMGNTVMMVISFNWSTFTMFKMAQIEMQKISAAEEYSDFHSLSILNHIVLYQVRTAYVYT